jgi:hypothetical protein
MTKTFQKYQDVFLVGLAIGFVLAIGGFYFWTITSLYERFDSALSVDIKPQEASAFQIDLAIKILKERGFIQ